MKVEPQKEHEWLQRLVGADSDETFHPFQRKVATCSKAKLPVIGAKRRWSFVLRQVVCQVKL
jgi:hypothetical protein